ncbi:hypothetical protein BSL78_20435 [Apostichopus japonicus]|uniref:YqaJ viral recombinase domain-containing protein n=1 Tax=Stichopus japonicus TaxID=307972 RepID=A0A2G8K3Y2_STIJA|nr:hypothetical protein BSL78_20435 [Apostichopus japonicus]
MRGYCTCFAGLGSSCNHVGAILYKVDLAWRTGRTRRSVTGQECAWNRYGAKKNVEPKRVADMDWSKPHFSKHGLQSPINPPERQLFSPTQKDKATPALSLLTNHLLPACPDACFLQQVDIGQITLPNYATESDVNIECTVDVSTTACIPPPITTLARTMDNFFEKLPVFTDEQVKQIEEETRGQANNPTWIAQRQGRLTASKVHAVVTRVRTISKSRSQVDTTGLVNFISGISSPNPDLPALKYGREMESQARNNYVSVMRTHGHPSTTVTECGLFVHPQFIYLAATPDGIVKCKCCGTGLLEIKCPLSISDQIPSSDCVAYLEDDDKGNTVLKRSHGYYFQVQMQLGVTKTQWCDFLYFQPMAMSEKEYILTNKSGKKF